MVPGVDRALMVVGWVRGAVEPVLGVDARPCIAVAGATGELMLSSL